MDHDIDLGHDAMVVPAAHGASPSPATASPVVGSPTAQPTTIPDFIAALKLPIEDPLLRSPPRLRVSRPRDDIDLVPRRSDRLAAKSVYRDTKPENQAKRVMLNKWKPRSAATQPLTPATPDAAITTRSHENFAEPLSSSKRATMRELFLQARAR